MFKVKAYVKVLKVWVIPKYLLRRKDDRIPHLTWPFLFHDVPLGSSYQIIKTRLLKLACESSLSNNKFKVLSLLLILGRTSVSLS